jgi:LysR family transcriptional regulator, benzoate and cis,cis-muconate-responsive activator of ben and cat genes
MGWESEAREALQRVDDAVQTAKIVGTGQRGEIHVGYAPSLAVEVLPLTLRYFHEASPGVRVRLHDLSTQEMLPGLVDGELQVALLESLSIKVTTGLGFEELQRYPFCVAVHPTHPLARGRKVGLEQVAQERLLAVTLSDYPDYHAIIDRVFAPLNRVPQIAEEFDSATSLIAALEGGRGVALVSQALKSFAGPRLKILPLRPSPPPLIVGIAYRKSKLSPATAKFIAAARRAGSGRPRSSVRALRRESDHH